LFGGWTLPESSVELPDSIAGFGESRVVGYENGEEGG